MWRCLSNLIMRGFAPDRRVTFVSAKVTKTISARAWPYGFPRSENRILLAAELAPLKQSSPKSVIRFSRSATPKAGRETFQSFTATIIMNRGQWGIQKFVGTAMNMLNEGPYADPYKTP